MSGTFNSLRAAKSKANYLFEGDFRRRPNQNLSGASRSLARGELLQQAAEQRQNREDTRRKEQASIKIQALWRGHVIRTELGNLMRAKFDHHIVKLNQEFIDTDFDILFKEFVTHYVSKLDRQRLEQLLGLMMQYRGDVVNLLHDNPLVWLHRTRRILKLTLGLVERYCHGSDPVCIEFLEYFTRPNDVLSGKQAADIWVNLSDDRIFVILRKLIDSQSLAVDGAEDFPIKIIRRFLETRFPNDLSMRHTPMRRFLQEFFRGPLSEQLEGILDDLILLQFEALSPARVMEEFKNYKAHSIFGDKQSYLSGFDCSGAAQDPCSTSWLCVVLIKVIGSQINELDDQDKVTYISILSELIKPANHIASLSLLQAHNKLDSEDEDEQLDELMNQGSVASHNSPNHQPEIDDVITKLVSMINEPSHINNLKGVFSNEELMNKAQGAIVHICNLMLIHIPQAIFSCRLLYTVAFNKQFTRLLWKNILSLSLSNLYHNSGPIYRRIVDGTNIDLRSWELILPPLKLFCSLYSYILLTLDDEEFRTDSTEMVLDEDSASKELATSDINLGPSAKQQASKAMFFIDKELISISATLRDICVGLIGILYQTHRQPYGAQVYMRNDLGIQDDRSKILSLEKKLSFKALVRLICQLHARDSRNQFCPDKHWICPSVVIPANEAIDFQQVTSQRGRLLTRMTRDVIDDVAVMNSTNDIKTVLILQEIPFVVAFHDRVQIFHRLLNEEKQLHQSEGYHFGLPGTAIQVQIRRNYIYEDAFDKLSYENEPNLKIPLKVRLINAAGAEEAGIDGGGLTKEFLSELLKAGFDPMRGFFKATKDHHLYPNPSAQVLFSNLAEGFEVHYEFLGRILGKAIFEKIMVELPMASFFLEKLLARKHSSDVDLQNLASLDPILYKNLVYLKNYKGDVSELNLDFTISNNDLGEREVIELKPGGSKMPVTKDNKIEYVHLVAHYRLNTQIRKQCAAFKRGLSQLIDLDWLRMFDARELQILISGAPTEIDVNDWRRHTHYENGYSDNSGPVNTFWRVVETLDETQRRKLLKFTTSCSLAPLLGFRELVPRFTIVPSEEQRLPTASTCMNLLKLPQCEDEHTMKTKLLYAIESNSGFELS